MPPSLPPPREGYGPATRAVLVLLGAGLALPAFGVLLFLLFGADFQPHRFEHPLNEAVALGGLGILGSYGLVLVLRGARGRRRLNSLGSRLSARLARPIGVAFLLWPGFGLIVIAAAAGLPAAELPAPLFRFVWCVAAAGLLFPVSIALHEVGHWVAARAVGLRVQTLRIGPLTFERAEGRQRVQLDWTSPTSLLGLNRLDLPDGLPSRARSLVFILGGPAANALAAAGCFALQSTAHDAWLGVAWVVNLYLAVLNLFPLRPSGHPSDGMQALSLLRASSADRLLAHVLQKLPSRRPREWGISSRQLLEALEGARSSRSPLFVFAFAVAQDGGDLNAQAILDAALEDPSLTQVDRYDLELQASLRTALVLRSAAEARAQLEAVDRDGEQHAFYPRLAEAAVLLAEGRRAEARAALASWEQAVSAKGSLAPFLLAGNQWALERLHQELDPADEPCVSLRR